jgi:predicted nuclease of predicted toxin-antitoxin system
MKLLFDENLSPGLLVDLEVAFCKAISYLRC